MGNINQPISRYLFNEVLNKDWGMFKDENSVTNLFLKKHGRQIPKTGTSVTVTDYDPGKFHASFLQIVKRPVIEGTPFEFGYSFVKKEQKPGVHNNEYFTHQQYYGGKVLAALANVNGVMSDTDVISIEDQIIYAAKLHYNDSSCIDKCFVNLRRAYVVNDSDNTDASGFTVTLEDGTTTVIATASTFAAGQLGVQFNADSDVNTKLVALRIGTNKYLITSIDPFYKFSIGTLVDTTISARYIYAENLELGYDVEAQFNYNEATKTTAFITVIDAATTTSADSTECAIWIDGVSHANAGHATFATFVSQFNASGFTDHGVFAIGDKDEKIFIYGPGTLTSMNLVLGTDHATSLSIVKESTPKGQYAALTSDDVFRLFMNKGNHGGLATQQYITQPVDGGVYRKYRIATTFTQDAVGGAAGGKESVEQVVELYVLKSQAIASKFVQDGSTGRYMDETLPAGADTSLDTLIRTTLLA